MRNERADMFDRLTTDELVLLLEQDPTFELPKCANDRWNRMEKARGRLKVTATQLKIEARSSQEQFERKEKGHGHAA